ncbi:MAG: hypothetical protein SRB1_02758 [Desulfobacteraceae bacterium Eth-SRB1]|nr:MAG: hypothetical protein SRB1_02758 [Desulfobacteraceae bacterium Eth-SRB1]
MHGLDSVLKEYYRDKRECVIDFPEPLFPSRKVEEYRAMSLLAIVEIAGRDSVAAAVKAVEDEGFTDLLPTYVYTGTEYGAWSSVGEAVKRLSKRLPEIRVHPPLVFGSPLFWQALNGRFINELITKYGFFTPCIGCHLYLHSVRIPLALALGKAPIISGERESHDGSIKINQISEALTVYQEIAKGFGIRLFFPLRHISEGNRIKEILGFEWDQGKDQLGCILSGNYRRLDGSIGITGKQVLKYLEEFACPLTREIIETYVAGQIPDHKAIAADVLG